MSDTIISHANIFYSVEIQDRLYNWHAKFSKIQSNKSKMYFFKNKLRSNKFLQLFNGLN